MSILIIVINDSLNNGRKLWESPGVTSSLRAIGVARVTRVTGITVVYRAMRVTGVTGVTGVIKVVVRQ